jgi:hypothetical protein
LQTCGRELKVFLGKRLGAKESKERKKKLLKYVPNISSAVFGLLESIRTRRESGVTGRGPESSKEKALIEEMNTKKLTVKSLEARIQRLVEDEVDKADDLAFLEGKNGKGGEKALEQDIYMKVLQDFDFDWERVVEGVRGVFVPAKRAKKR